MKFSQDLEKGKICFKCTKVKFNLFNWNYSCRLCQHSFCAGCIEKVRNLKQGFLARCLRSLQNFRLLSLLSTFANVIWVPIGTFISGRQNLLIRSKYLYNWFANLFYVLLGKNSGGFFHQNSYIGLDSTIVTSKLVKYGEKSNKKCPNIFGAPKCGRQQSSVGLPPFNTQRKIGPRGKDRK